MVITSLPIQDMALLSLGIALNEETERVIRALLAGEPVMVLADALEYKQYRKTAPLGVYQKFTAMERRLREMGIGLLRR